jgi:hypothetical protein
MTQGNLTTDSMLTNNGNASKRCPTRTYGRSGRQLRYGVSESESRPTTFGSVRAFNWTRHEKNGSEKKPAKNDKSERNINDFAAVDLMAAQRSCPICKLPLWKEKYDAVVKGHVRMDLE